MQVECDDVLSDLGFSLKTNVLIEVVNDEGIYEMEYKQNNKNFWKFFSIGSELDIKYPNNKWILSTVRKVKKDEYGKIIKILVNCDGQGPNCDN